MRLGFNPRATCEGRATAEHCHDGALTASFNPRATCEGRATSERSTPKAQSLRFQSTRDL